MRTILHKEDLTPGEIARRVNRSHLRARSNIDNYLASLRVRILLVTVQRAGRGHCVDLWEAPKFTISIMKGGEEDEKK